MFNDMSYGVTPDQLIKAMKGEADAQAYYRRLVTMTHNPKEEEIIRKIFEDEIKHFNTFQMIFRMITGYDCVLPTITTPVISSYFEGVGKAIMDELQTYEYYRDIYLNSANNSIMNAFFQAFTDENEHAAYLNYILTTNKR